MTRRTAIALSFTLPLIGDDRTDALDAVAPLASALANSDVDAFASALPADLPNRSELRENVAALIAQAEVTSSVEVISAESGKAELDWYMQIRSRQTSMLIERRRGTVHVSWGKKRRLTSIAPVSFFAPPKAN